MEIKTANLSGKEAVTHKGFPLVSVVIPTFQRADVLPETLAAFSSIDFPQSDFEVIVVDDGSKDSTEEVVTAFKKQIQNLVYCKQTNSGVATARNHGARIARGEFLIFNDDDIIVEKELITKHLRHLEKYEKSLTNGHWEFAPEMTKDLENSPFGRFRIKTEVWVKTGIEKNQIDENLFVPSGVTACNLGIRKSDFWEIGGFDEDFPFAGCEDQEFSLRASKNGYRFLYDYDLKLLHNDRRLSVEQFGERQRRGAITKVLLAVKFPEETADHPMIVENGAVKSDDTSRLKVKKIIKGILSKDFSLKALLKMTEIIEKREGSTAILPKMYNLLCGVYIFRGIREGIELYGSPQKLPLISKK